MPTSHESTRPATEAELAALIQEYGPIAGRVASDALGDLFQWVVAAASPEQRQAFVQDLAVLVLSSLVTAVAYERGLVVPRGVSSGSLAVEPSSP